MKLKKLRKISRRNAMILIAGFTGTAILPSVSFAQASQALDRINEITKGLKLKSDICYLYQKLQKMVIKLQVSFDIDSALTESDHIKTVYILAVSETHAPDASEILFHA